MRMWALKPNPPGLIHMGGTPEFAEVYPNKLQAEAAAKTWWAEPLVVEVEVRAIEESADRPEWRWEDHPDTVLSDPCANGTCDRCPSTVACGHPCHTKDGSARGPPA